jgi:tetratricopeptide (TPR) repeat protein
VLRPPTFGKLLAALEEKTYHIVHFDGHGSYTTETDGVLIFEKDTSNCGEEISATILGELLRRHNIPLMVLNACQSAKIDTQTKDPFTTIATSLLHAGTHNVVAMSYSLLVSGAKVFVPAFYQQLFKTGDVTEATLAGRRAMYLNQKRDTFYGQITFHDWIVPVLYQQQTTDILPKLQPNPTKKETQLPSEVQNIGDYGFIGRDQTIQQLEHAIRLKPAGILIHGIAGEGKTTLTKGFLQWLENTNGLGTGVFWFNFQDINNAEHIITTLTNALFGMPAMALPTEQQLSNVTQVLKNNPFFIVWDNFESASGIPNTEISALLPKADRNLLKHFLHDLRGGKTKVLITSRSPETWLTPQECNQLQLDGLNGEELWQYSNAIVNDFGLSFERESKTYIDLMNKLAGNPLAVRAILLRLQEKSAAAILNELENNITLIGTDEGTQRIQVALAVFEKGIDRTYAPTLRLLGLHEHHADTDLLGDMLKEIGETTPPEPCFTTLESAGLCHHIGNNIYKIHPALRSCLVQLHPAQKTDKQTFVEVMSNLAGAFTSKELHKQRRVFMLFSACFHYALNLSQELNNPTAELTLTEALAIYAQNTRNFSEAEKLYADYAEVAKKHDNTQAEAVAYHQLGMIAEERRDFINAEKYYKQSLTIKLKMGNEYGAAKTYHQLGRIAEERRDFDSAENWYQKSLKIFEQLGDQYSTEIVKESITRLNNTKNNLTTGG